MPGYYFIRANGETMHNDPAAPACFRPDKPPQNGANFNHAQLCVQHGFARMGWPAVGDIIAPKRVPSSTPCYGNIASYILSYLDSFRAIAVGSIILMPDPAVSGRVYVGRTTGEYHYVNATPYECAHRVAVDWDRAGQTVVEYDSAGLGMKTSGWPWLKAFGNLSAEKFADLRAAIDAGRRKKTQFIDRAR